MKRSQKIDQIRSKLHSGDASVGSWMQIPHSSIAEILAHSGYDWVAIDLEHGAVSTHQLPDLFRALHSSSSLGLARLAHGGVKECKQALDAGAGGVIVPMIETAQQLRDVRDAICWPPAGKRGVGFSTANLFGKNFSEYLEEAQSPFLVAMIEHVRAMDELEEILSVEGLDAVLVGPYDLSASLGLTGQVDHPQVTQTIQKILKVAQEKSVPCGLHIVEPSLEKLKQAVENGYRFLAYSVDTVFLRYGADFRGIDK